MSLVLNKKGLNFLLEHFKTTTNLLHLKTYNCCISLIDSNLLHLKTYNCCISLIDSNIDRRFLSRPTVWLFSTSAKMIKT